ncbi:MAG TPA: hypothetical protein DDY59_13205 [Lachnospiraceae bacterium]|jgi:hypothetical protein|nr:hypothetical protein [Lachnospiraceae bacterium]HCM13240.1 hypothetical protein [Lachnospiraceae bacterium]
MQKKVLILSVAISSILFLVLLIGLFTESARTNKIKEEVVYRRIEDFTNQYFTFAEKVRINTSDGKMSVSTSFVPEVGSFPVKEDIYQSIAYHALQIVTFFPEVNHFDYIVLWDDNSKQEVMTLAINEDAIKQLAKIYYGEYINQNGGIETSFRKVFSSIVETEESKSWRERIDPNSDIP